MNCLRGRTSLFGVQTTSIRPHIVVGTTADGQEVVEVKFDDDRYIISSDRYRTSLIESGFPVEKDGDERTSYLMAKSDPNCDD